MSRSQTSEFVVSRWGDDGRILAGERDLWPVDSTSNYDNVWLIDQLVPDRQNGDRLRITVEWVES